MNFNSNNESLRLQAARENKAGKKWGPYLSERQWDIVCEDYSDNGNPWDLLGDACYDCEGQNHAVSIWMCRPGIATFSR